MLRTVLAAVGTVLASGVLAAADPPAVTSDTAGYAKTIEPFFKSYCNTCHTGEKSKGDFRIEASALPNDFSDATAKGKWKEVVNVLSSHEMPPKKSKQPTAGEVSAVVDWVTAQTVRAELAQRSRSVTLRRLNRDEYRNTIRDLIGIDFDVSVFPQDAAAGGFDNNGGALTMSPVQVETYLSAARQILDRALVEGPRPKGIKWHFDPKVGPTDRTRLRLDATNNAIVNGGRINKQEANWVVIRLAPLSANAREFQVPVAGDYVIRVHAAGRAPDRTAVVKVAEGHLTKQRDERDKRNPKGTAYSKLVFDRTLEHFKTDPMYVYGPPRMRVSVDLGSQHRVLTEIDVDAPPDKPRVYEFTAPFSTESAGVSFEYAYSIPAVLENATLQGLDDFPRPELLIDWFEIEGPVHATWPPPSHANILFDSPARRNDERGYASEVLSRFMRKAYRRPVAPAEVAAKMALYDAGRKAGLAFTEAIKRPLAAVLVSPHFLFLVEPSGALAGPARALTDHELASRLSYFLWSAPPDEELMRAADAGQLVNKADRLKQVDRLLADPRHEAFVQNFAGQWLNLREVGANPPVPALFPQYDRHLELSIVKESESFFRTVLDEDLDARTLIKSDFVVINERLARFYGVPGVRGDAFRKVPVPKGVHRGGVVTQAAVLAITSNGTRTSPVKRGAWVLKTLLGTDPGLPVANVGEIAPKVPGIDKATVRKRLEIHRQLAQCARCHNKIDPPGFALENYNASGEWREKEGFGYNGRIEASDPKIDASAQMPDGTKIVGVAGLQAALLKQEDLFLQCLAAKVLTYALGRELGLADQPTVKAAAAHMKQNGRTLKSLIRFVVTSEPFETK